MTEEATTPHPETEERTWEPVEAALEAIELRHTASMYCDNMEPSEHLEKRTTEDGVDILVCVNCADDPSSPFTKNPIVWRDDTGVVF